MLSLVAFTTACAQSDAGITTSVMTQLAADDLVKARNIVGTQAEKARALEIARGAENVLRVEDKLTIGRQV